MRKNIFIAVVISVLTVWLYFPILNDFFQQDEWSGFSDIYLAGAGNYLNYLINSFIPDPGHYVPFARILFATAFEVFVFDYSKWAALSIVWHVSNSILIYFLTKRIFKDDTKSILTAILFAVFAAGQQATSWAVADGATHGATFFVLLSSILFFDGRTFWSLMALLVSMFFKEISIGMFLFLPLVALFQNYIDKKKIFDSRVLYFLLAGVGYLVFRYLTFLGIFSSVVSPVVTESQSLKEILFNLITFPIKGISQTIIPPFIFLELSKFIAIKMPDGIAGLPGTNFFDNFYLKYVFGALVAVVFLIVSVLTLLLLRFKKNKMTTIAIFALLFTAINSVIYAMSPARGGFVPIIDSRNLYLPSIGMALFIVAVSSQFKKWNLSYLLILLFIISNLLVTKVELSKISEAGETRENILNQISRDNLKLSQKQIFYIESDTSYYGLPDEIRIPPFQSGFGKTLLVWYQETEKFALEFFNYAYLWPIDSQGYKEIDGRGFGYFRDFDLLKSTLKEYNLPEDIVVAYSWNGKENKLTNISEIVRSKLKNEKVIRK